MTTLSHSAVPRASAPILRRSLRRALPHIVRRALARLRAALAQERALTCPGLTFRTWLLRDLGLTQADLRSCAQQDLDLRRRVYWF